jgi:hypothetical protein
MSTRSRIAVQDSDGSYLSVYHHFDGYPEGLGITLQQHVPTFDKGWRLVAGGDISYIDWETGNVKYYAKRSEWDNPRGGSSEAWEDVKPAVSKSFEDLLDVTNDSNGCYLYVYYFQTNGVRCYDPNTKEEVRIPKSRKQEEVA